MENKKNLMSKLVSIMEEAGTVKKEGFNDFNKYKYVKESDVAEKLQGLFVKHKVFVFSSVLEANERQIQSSTGKANMYATVKMLYTFVDAENSEDRFEVQAYGSGMDVGDKAIYKALTGAHKYFLIRNFNLGSDDDAEKESPAVGETKEKTVLENIF
jgi:hypothetical protein